MKFRSTLVLLVLATGAWLIVRFWLAEVPGTRETAHRDQYATAFNGDKIERIVIHRRESVVVLEKEADRWKLLEPITDHADPLFISQILGELEMIRREDTIEAPEDKDALGTMHEEFGVAEPRIRVELTGEGAPEWISIGHPTALEHLVYLQIAGEDAVHAVPAQLEGILSRPTNDFRDHRLTDLPWDLVESIEIERTDGRIQLDLVRGEWELVRPFRARADSALADAILRAVIDTRILSFEKDGASPTAHRLPTNPPTLTLHRSGGESPFVMQLGRLAEEEEIAMAPDGATFVALPGRKAVVLAPVELSRLFELNPNDLRDRKLMRIDLDTVDRFRVEPAGTPGFEFHRHAEEWTLHAGDGEFAANGEMIMTFLDLLRSTDAAQFVADTVEDLEPYSLDAPQLRIAVSSYTSENVPGVGTGEHPLAALAFGRSQGDLVFARLEREPFIVAVDRGLLADIPVDPILWRSLDLLSIDPSQIRVLRLVRGGRQTEYTRSVDGEWQTAEGRDFDPVALESAAATLSSLYAARWVGPTVHGHRFDQPTATFEIEFGDGNGDRLQLVVGSGTGDGNFHARLGDAFGTFLLSGPTASILLAPEF